ncbi:MAG: polysaccharide biosynthesis tyrosine autokinase [Bacteroidales bacterium]|nr:polysaccharide biosynthesis tyrosine autokinase [Bacteroidales bacterium]
MNPESQHNNIYQEESIDIKKYLFKFLANWYWFAIALSVALAIAYMVNRYSEPTYTISSSLIISDKQSDAASVEAIVEQLGRSRVRRKATVVNEISILKSYKMAHLALEELDFGISYVGVGKREIAESKLYHNCPFIVIPDTSFTQKNNYPVNIKILSNKEYLLEINDQFDIHKKLKFGQVFSSEIFKFKVKLRNPETFDFMKGNSNKYFFKFQNSNSLANLYRNKLNIDVNDEKGSILNLKMNGFVPEKMAAYLNKLSDVYIRSALIEKNERAENTLNFIDDQLNIIVKDLNAAEIRLQDFRTQNKVINLSQKGTMLYNELTSIQNDRFNYDVKAKYLNYLESSLQKSEQNTNIVAPSVLGITDPSLQKLIESYNSRLSEKNKFSQVAQEDAPNIIVIQNEINKLKKTLADFIVSAKKTNQIALQAFTQKQDLINQQIYQLPANERQQINIEREYKLNNELYTFLLEKRAEAGITKASNVADNKVLDIARPENAAQLTPKRSQNYMMALVLGLGIPGAIILALGFLNTKIEDKKDIERSTHIPIIGTIGHNETLSEIAVYMDPKSSIAESFRALRTNLQYILREKDQKIVMITSTVSGEGKTFAAVNLASILAMSNKKVLLVGLDLRKPSLHKVFDFPNEIGISTFLSNQSTYESIIQETSIENLYLAPSGPIPPNPAELIETKQMQDFLNTASKKFDYIIIDTPPLALVTDALLVSQYAHANIFMIRQRYSNKQVFELINKLEQDQKISKMNILVNDLKIPKYYGYNYGYNYGYGYGYEFKKGK